jgi:hypothetical protein
MLGGGAVELGKTLQRHDAVALEVERRCEIEIGGVVGVPEMVVGRADDRVERVGAAPIALDGEHRGEIIGHHSLVGGIVGDRALGGFGLRHEISALMLWSRSMA